MEGQLQVLKNSRGNILLAFKEGRDYVHCVAQNGTVYIDRITPDAEVELDPALLRGKPYPVHIAAARMLSFGLYMGITERAKFVLENIIAQTKEVA